MHTHVAVQFTDGREIQFENYEEHFSINRFVDNLQSCEFYDIEKIVSVDGNTYIMQFDDSEEFTFEGVKGDLTFERFLSLVDTVDSFTISATHKLGNKNDIFEVTRVVDNINNSTTTMHVDAGKIQTTVNRNSFTYLPDDYLDSIENDDINMEDGMFALDGFVGYDYTPFSKSIDKDIVLKGLADCIIEISKENGLTKNDIAEVEFIVSNFFDDNATL